MPTLIMTRQPSGQANLTAIVLLLGIVITAVWVWKRLSLETQDYLIDQAIPIALLAAVCLVVVWTAVRAIRSRKQRLRRRSTLLASFARETSQEKRLETAFALIEVNDYRLEGLESVVPALKELFTTTLQRAVGDKQHRIRGMAASHLGVLQDPSVVPLLVKALEDDHAYVRSCSALALGRLRAIEAKERLTTVMKDDWDQTVRSRAKEALERMGAK
jgi:HEAT repeat protein